MFINNNVIRHTIHVHNISLYIAHTLCSSQHQPANMDVYFMAESITLIHSGREQRHFNQTVPANWGADMTVCVAATRGLRFRLSQLFGARLPKRSPRVLGQHQRWPLETSPLPIKRAHDCRFIELLCCAPSVCVCLCLTALIVCVYSILRTQLNCFRTCARKH